jgi:tetratricopeptide (TPR) repeat protein
MDSRIGFGLLLLLWGVPAWAQTPDAIYKKAFQLFLTRDLISARQQFLRLLHNPAFATKSRYHLGRIAQLEAKPSEAIQWLEAVAALDPPFLDAAAQLGKAYLDTGQLAKAKNMTERAIHYAPWDGALHYRLGRIHQQMGDAQSARKEFAESVRLKSADRESVQLLLECSQHLASGETSEAMRVRGQLLSNPSLDPDVLVALGLVFTSARMHQESLEPFETAANRDSNFFQAQYNTGLALLKVGRAADALRPLQASLTIVPDSMDANGALSLAYVLQGRYADAIPVLERWHRMQEENPRAATMLALAYLRTGSAAKSVPLLRNVLAQSHTDPKPHFLLIEALNASEQQAEALGVAEEAARVFPDIAQAHLAKAQQLARLGRYAQAGPEFTQVLKLEPNEVDALLGLAEIQQKQGDYSVGLQTYNQVLAIDGANATATLGAARNLILLDKAADARPILESGIQAHPENSQMHYELSRVYARLGEKVLAAEQTKIVQELRAREAKTQ